MDYLECFSIQPAHDVRMTVYGCCFNVLMSFQRSCDVVLTLCAVWVSSVMENIMEHFSWENCLFYSHTHMCFVSPLYPWEHYCCDITLFQRFGIMPTSILCFSDVVVCPVCPGLAAKTVRYQKKCRCLVNFINIVIKFHNQ